MRPEHGRIDPALIYLMAGVVAFLSFLFALPEPPPPEAAASAAPASDFAIVDAMVFDGERFLPHRDVGVEEGHIKAVGRRLDLPEDLPRIDGRGHTVLPGLIDGHVHSFASALQDSLRFGVTTVLDQFTSVDLIRAHRATRVVLAATDQADLYSAGMIATAPMGHGTQFGVEVVPVTGPADAPAWVRARKAEGSDWIKIAWEDGSAFGREIASLDRDTVAALIAAAHAEGMRAVVHASRLERGLDAMALGADGLVHIWADAVISEADATRMSESGMFVIPTLSVISSAAGSAMSAQLRDGVDPSMLSAMQRQTLSAVSPYTGSTTGLAIENVRRLHAAGVPLVAGTDAPNPGTAYGISIHGELQLLMQAGLSGEEALAAATSSGADAFQLTDRGRLEAGRIADLLLVSGDLSVDLSSSGDIVTLWKDGFPVLRQAVTDALGDIEPAPETTLISDFDAGLDSAFGAGWSVTEDSMMGGSSDAALAWRDGALSVSGELRSGFAFPWAGAIWFPGEQPMRPVDFGGRETLSFRVRGDGRDYRILLFSTAKISGPPPSVGFATSADWATVTISLADFPTERPEIIAALAFVAQQPVGSYAFELDDLEIH